MKLERIKEFLVYDPVTGDIKNLRGRNISQDDDGYVLITDPKDKKKKKFRFAYLCWAMCNGRFPEASEKIIHRNLNKQDTSLCNLYLVSNEEYKKYKNSHKNLTGQKDFWHPHVGDVGPKDTEGRGFKLASLDYDQMVRPLGF